MKQPFIAADVLALARFVLSLPVTDTRTANARRVASKIRRRYEQTRDNKPGARRSVALGGTDTEMPQGIGTGATRQGGDDGRGV